MRVSGLPVVKVCCISSPHEAHLAIAAGASALGLVSFMPSGPGVISEDAIAEIAASVPPPIATFLLTARQDAEGIIRQQRRCGVNTLQLVDEVPFDELRALRTALPGVKLVQVIHVMGSQSVEQAQAVAPYADALLLDSGNPTLKTKELGGTGRVHDWSLSRQIRDLVPIPVFLAGGLHQGNVAEAVQVVRPFGLDLCSSLRTDGLLDEAKLRDFFAAMTAIVAE